MLYLPNHQVRRSETGGPTPTTSYSREGMGGRINGFHSGSPSISRLFGGNGGGGQLSKYAHFGALKARFDAPRVACLFIDTVVKHHGFPERLLSDRDAIFMSTFWTELLSLSGTKLQFTTAYHPQTDGQSEVTNRALEQYLRAFTFDCPTKWSLLLPWAELAMNCTFNASIRMCPFKALYGRDPPNVFATQGVPVRTPEVADLVAESEETLRILKSRLSREQTQMAKIANRHRRDVEFSVGDNVFLKLNPYRQYSVGRPLAAMLGRRFYGPFRVTERIGKVAYRLQLPAESRIHDVFHVSLLRPFVPPLSDSLRLSLPSHFRNNQPSVMPELSWCRECRRSSGVCIGHQARLLICLGSRRMCYSNISQLFALRTRRFLWEGGLIGTQRWTRNFQRSTNQLKQNQLQPRPKLARRS